MYHLQDPRCITPIFVFHGMLGCVLCRLIFIQAVKDGESASPVQSLVGTSAQALDLNRLDPLKGNALFRDVQWDFSNESIDPHIVGLAVAAE